MLDTPAVKEAALMDKIVYGDKLSKEDQKAFDASGWQLSKKVTGIEFAQKKSGFKSTLFERTINGETEYTYAFAGTDGPSLKDWGNNFKQILGASKQYDLAISNTKEIIRQIGSKELTLSGHSLGGGLANASALATGKPSITFNPAWVSTATANKYGLLSKPQTGISNYIIVGEILDKTQRLSHAQSPLILRHVGKDYFLWSPIPLLPFGDVYSHLIDPVLGIIRNDSKYNKTKGWGATGGGGKW